ncbi:hypothetical protein JHK86_055050 [Glycine max]|nr:hypothetical protein JHK86_055050 [Glycine max]
MKPRYDGSSNEAPSFNKELKRSFTSERTTLVGKKSHEENKSKQGTLFRNNKFMGHASMPLVSQPAEKESLLVESNDDDDDDDTETEDQDVEGGRTVAQNNDRGKGPPVIGGESSKTDGDEGPDVDKKADEFIAKRIESIKRSRRSARNSLRKMNQTTHKWLDMGGKRWWQRHTFDGFSGSLKAKHNGLPKSSPTLSGTRFFPSFLRPTKVSKCSNEERLMLKPKDVPQKISARHEFHKHELDNVVAVTEAQPSLRQTPTQAEGETTRMPWEYPFRDSFLS